MVNEIKNKIINQDKAKLEFINYLALMIQKYGQKINKNNVK